MEPHTQLREPVDTNTPSDTLSSPRKINGLVPTLPTVSFFKKKTITFSYKDEGLDLSSLAIDLYIYGTGADPRELDFHEKGGICYIVAVWRGRVTYFGYGFVLSTWAGSLFSSPVRVMEAVEIEPTSYSAEPEEHSSDTPVQDDIQFESTLPMFKDDGRDIYEFTAKYQDRFYSKNIQRGYSENNNLVIESEDLNLVIDSENNNLVKMQDEDISGVAVHRLAYAEPVNFGECPT